MDERTTFAALVQRYAAAPDLLESALSDPGRGGLDAQQPGGRWTVRVVVHHLVDSDEIARLIMKAALARPGCRLDLSWYGPNDAWADALGHRDRSVDDALRVYRAGHAAIVDIVERSADAPLAYVRLTAPGRRSERPVSLEYLLRSQSDHLDHHLAQIVAAWHAREDA
jgi:hypothetical protein